ncbi:hypothetical protein JCM10908_005512 [Rhodotorula pacifica]|uniref:uncharacterized protein n=1 Tax=Rhodotorula pacifica TaxID=1495444 RepID=UPI003172FE15
MQADAQMASTSAYRLDTLPLLDKTANISTTATAAVDDPETDGSATPDAAEPIPSLSSLLLSTAESLAARSSSASLASTSAAVPPTPNSKPIKGLASKNTASKQQQQPFTLSTSPEALLSHPAAPPYLASLLAQPLSQIESLPATLASQSTALDQDLSSLAYTRYSAFLQSHAAAQSISALFTTLSDSLAALLDSTSSLEQAATSFGTKIHSVRDKRERMARVRDRIGEVEELLDAPSVVDACVRAGYWSEAIDVATRLENLHKRLLANASSLGSVTESAGGADAEKEGGEEVYEEGRGARALLDRIRGEVNVALLSLRTRVLESLVQRNLKLPGAVRAVGVLRRIAERGLAADRGRKAERNAPHTAATARLHDKTELDEDALRVVFLVARWKCLRGELAGVEAQMTAAGIHLGKDRAGELQAAKQDLQVSAEENDERTRWTKRWIEVWREIVGETITMYAEVFLGSAGVVANAAGKQKEANGDAADTLQSHALSPTAPLHLFLSTALESLSTVLARAIAGLNSSTALSSLVTQLTYCSHSFARYGLDFRQVIQLRERVELRIGRIVALEWEAAGRKWEKEWRDAWGHSGGAVMTAAKARRSGRVPLTDWLVVPEGLSTALSTATPSPPTSFDAPASDTWHHQPSPSIALFPPLARFLNAHATALNSLRLLPPVSLYTPLRRAQAIELDRATQVLSAFTDAWLAAIASTPLLASPGFASAAPTPTPGAAESDLHHLSADERTIVQERDEERRAVAAAVAWFGRAVIPWCAEALETGVYAELVESGRAGERRVADGVKQARRRCEQLVAKIEGGEYVEPSAVPSAQLPTAAMNGQVSEGKGSSLKSPPPITTELPVIDPDAAVSATPSAHATPSSTLDPSAALNGNSSKPADFLVSPVDGATEEDELEFEVDGATPSDEGTDEAAAPYVVHEKAPPPPAPAEPGASALQPDSVDGPQ